MSLNRARLIACALVAIGFVGAEPTPGESGLTMSRGVVCGKIHGFAKIEPLPEPKLTPDDKLTIYYEPSGFKTEEAGDGYRAMLVQDGKIRKKGRKEPIWSKEKMFEYEAKSETPPKFIYMRVDVMIKGLTPGDYEFDFVLHDGLAKAARPATQSVSFTVVAAKMKE